MQGDLLSMCLLSMMLYGVAVLPFLPPTDILHVLESQASSSYEVVA